jgi:hypothetical protein
MNVAVLSDGAEAAELFRAAGKERAA